MIDLKHALRKRILPAVTFEIPEQALRVAEIFLKKGLDVMEIPLRTPAAFKAIEMVRQNFPEMYIGAGTILSARQISESMDAGAMFGLSAGLNTDTVKAALEDNFPFIPGVMTPGEIENCVQLGLTLLKLFPAEQVGGVSFLKAVNGPYGHLNLKFIPMGGVNARNTREYLAQTNVIAIGGSWIATKSLLEENNYSGIEANVTALLES